MHPCCHAKPLGHPRACDPCSCPSQVRVLLSDHRFALTRLILGHYMLSEVLSNTRTARLHWIVACGPEAFDVFLCSASKVFASLRSTRGLDPNRDEASNIVACRVATMLEVEPSNCKDGLIPMVHVFISGTYLCFLCRGVTLFQRCLGACPDVCWRL